MTPCTFRKIYLQKPAAYAINKVIKEKNVQELIATKGNQLMMPMLSNASFLLEYILTPVDSKKYPYGCVDTFPSLLPYT